MSIYGDERRDKEVIWRIYRSKQELDSPKDGDRGLGKENKPNRER